jgi:predicted enzyme involved in methoxymalonyl-ACP biosynthesis
MNFSGNKYHESDIEKIAVDKNLDCYVIQCSDQFGDYGIVGFAVINIEQNRLVDLMFSCRIQSKRVEHAFITFCLNKYLAGSDFFVTYKHTERNRFSAQVFYDFDFFVESDEGDGGQRFLKFEQSVAIPDDKIVKLELK